MPSPKVAVAVSCCVVPLGIDFFAGVTATDVTVALSTVKVAVPTIGAFDAALDDAMMVAVPGATVLTRPAVDTVATDGFVDVQVTVLVRFFVVLLS